MTKIYVLRLAYYDDYILLGVFDDKEFAIAARMDARRQMLHEVDDIREAYVRGGERGYRLRKSLAQQIRAINVVEYGLNVYSPMGK